MVAATSFGNDNAGFQAGVINGSVNNTFQSPVGKLQGQEPHSRIFHNNVEWSCALPC